MVWIIFDPFVVCTKTAVVIIPLLWICSKDLMGVFINFEFFLKFNFKDYA